MAFADKVTIRWEPPQRLADYREAKRGPGIYIIGEAIDPAKPVTPNDEVDAYVFNWPDNLRSLYVGISLSRGEGVRLRLRQHFKGRGNRGIKSDLEAGKALWFVACYGEEVADFEALFIIMSTDGFRHNVRDEKSRFARRLNRKIEENMRANGIDPDAVPWFDERDG